jgi:hypothetical protein
MNFREISLKLWPLKKCNTERRSNSALGKGVFIGKYNLPPANVIWAKQYEKGEERKEENVKK